MMSHGQRIAAFLGHAPADLAAFYDGDALPDYPDSRIHCLPFDQALAYTRDMHGIPVVQRLGLWVLDDAEDSNPHAYVTQGPCTGAVVHFSHDGEPRVAFGSLAAFVAALHEAGGRGGDIDDLPPQAPAYALDAEITVLLGEDSEDAHFLVNLYLGICAPLQMQTQEALLREDDFLVREALAARLAQTARPQDLDTAQRLAADPHPQVARAGALALAAVRRAGR
ncbi:MAG TPA: hypothetical protein VGN52_10420 [Burkholderiales bacterium]|jgi:hypothetical protein